MQRVHILDPHTIAEEGSADAQPGLKRLQWGLLYPPSPGPWDTLRGPGRLTPCCCQSEAWTVCTSAALPAGQACARLQGLCPSALGFLSHSPPAA